MAKKTKNTLKASEEVSCFDAAYRQKRLHNIHPWDVQHYLGHSEIEAYVEITGNWDVIADVKGINHIAISDFIVSLVNGHNQEPNLFEGAIQALELCLESGNLDWSAEHDADVIVRKARSQNI